MAIVGLLAANREAERCRASACCGRRRWATPCPGAVIGVGVLIAAGRLRPIWPTGIVQALTGSGTGLVLSGTVAALLYAYLVRFFAVGFNPLEAGMAKIAPALGDAARVLGCRPLARRRRGSICRCCARA